jgi:ABC-2 type transport system ATP-binding protein
MSSAPSEVTSVLSVDGLVKRRGGRDVLSGVQFAVEAGEIVGLLGANGTGKSTIVSIIAELLPADAGSVTLDVGLPTPTRRTALGMATQEIALYPRLTCEENIRLFARLHGLHGARLRARVGHVIDGMGLGTYRQTRVEALSGGWQRRLHLAVALVHEPAVLLLDEPTVGLDVEARGLVWGQIRSLSAQGSAVLLTTHLIEEAEALCDRVIILAQGRVAAQGTVEQLRQLVPAVQLAAVVCDDSAGLRRRAEVLGIEVRDYADRSTLLLREPTSIGALAGQFREVGLQSVTLEPVSLLAVYLEVCGRKVTSAPGLTNTRDRAMAG